MGKKSTYKGGGERERERERERGKKSTYKGGERERERERETLHVAVQWTLCCDSYMPSLQFTAPTLLRAEREREDVMKADKDKQTNICSS
jgi:hypothetical protein